MLTVVHLRTEYLQNPIGIDMMAPHFSWVLIGDPAKYGQKQTAYRVVAAHSLEELNQGKYLWESGKVASDRSIRIQYQGPKLFSREIIFWKVKIWDEAGEES